MRLYDLEVSGNCFKVRLMCSFLGLPLELVPVDFMAGEHKKPPLTDLNPFGEIPIFVHGDLVLRDSQAILVYLARKYGGETWLPTEPVAMAKVMEWMMVGGNEIMRGPNDARLHVRFGYELDLDLARKKAARILGLMDAHLSKNQWLALGRPTIADIACLPYVGIGHEGGVTLTDYPAIRAWIERIKNLPGFITMSGL
ncbi:MAG: glutathione S-transferase [Hyphomicrobium sp.]|nr:MAG: glutathione S-transferase [Hyphomicrobium sp.]PPC99093.1 MAG: glutathione S-transferase [Hyphomicrobium sp.]